MIPQALRAPRQALVFAVRSGLPRQVNTWVRCLLTLDHRHRDIIQRNAKGAPQPAIRLRAPRAVVPAARRSSPQGSPPATQTSAGAVIPSTASRKAAIPYDRDAFRARNLVERLWCRLKDWRRIATRYDKLARNFLSSALIAAMVIYCAIESGP